MTQERAQKIIRSTYGKNAVAIGHAEAPDSAPVIFWIFRGESEEDYRTHEESSKKKGGL